MSTYRPPKSYASSLTYIDPASCGSAVGYRIGVTAYGRFDAELDLHSCDRRVSWDFSGNSKREFQENLRKLDEAFAALQIFRQELIEGRERFDRSRPKVKA